MNLSQLSRKFNTQAKCIAHLEKVRWKDEPICPKCESSRVYRRKKGINWHCSSCNKDFSVLKGTIFEGTRLKLPKWFQIIAIMLDAKKGISAKQLSRNVGLTYKTAWFSAMRVRCAMLDWGEMLEGIVEMDETYIGGKPRKRNQKGETKENVAFLSNVYDREDKRIKRGRGTKKVPVAGIAERKGRVIAKVMKNVSSKSLLTLLKQTVKVKDTTLMTDDFKSYKAFDKEIERLVVKHSAKEYARGAIHTNTIEGFWSIVKNGIKGQYHVLSKKYLPFYLAEFCYRYNRRQDTQAEAFNETINNTVVNDKCLVKYKPKSDVECIVYPDRKKSKPKPKGKRKAAK